MNRRRLTRLLFGGLSLMQSGLYKARKAIDALIRCMEQLTFDLAKKLPPFD